MGKEALGGNVEMMLEMAGAYQQGYGVETNPRNYFKWLLKAVDAGDSDADARFLLVRAYLSCMGEDPDQELYREWLKLF